MGGGVGLSQVGGERRLSQVGRGVGLRQVG